MGNLLMDYIFGTNKRLFINTSLGCNSSCSYCYLPFLNLSIGERVQKSTTFEEVLSRIKKIDLFTTGRQGTIISIGCYSECWDEKNRETTKKLISYFLATGNPVQFATKRQINWRELVFLKNEIQWSGQLIVFISCATVSEWASYEQGTSPPDKRFSGFLISDKLLIPSCLYIKPVLKGITIRDKREFSEVMKKYNVPSVVGSRFSNLVSDKLAPVGNGKLYCYIDPEEIQLARYLQKFGEVYQFSTDLINIWRNNDKL